MAAVPRSIRERRVYVDSSAYLALLDEDDESHVPAVRILNQLVQQRLRQFTSNALIIEAHSLILSAMGGRAAREFLRDIEASITVVVRVRAADEERAKQIIYRYDDKDFSLVDAISFAIMERLGISQAFTFDRHFAQFGFTILV